MVKASLKRKWEYFRLLYPCQAVLVTSQTSGKRDIMVSSALPVSFKPPLLAVSIAPTRYSCELIKKSGEFVVNIPSMNMMDKVLRCGATTGRKIDKFKDLDLTPARAKMVNAPIIDECIAHVECKVDKNIEAGDHMLILGRVLDAYAEEESLTTDEEGIPLWNLEKADVLLYIGGRTFTVAKQTFHSSTPYSFFKVD